MVRMTLNFLKNTAFILKMNPPSVKLMISCAELTIQKSGEQMDGLWRKHQIITFSLMTRSRLWKTTRESRSGQSWVTGAALSPVNSLGPESFINVHVFLHSQRKIENYSSKSSVP